MNMSVPPEWQVLVSLSTDKTVKLLSHVVNITVHSLSITWCNLYGNSLDDSYCILKCRKAELFMYAIYPFQKYKTLYCTWDIDCKRLFRNVWIIEDMVDLPIFSCTLQPASAIVRHDWQHGPQQWPLFHLICTSVLGLFCLFLCFASVPFHHASFLLFFLSAVDPDGFLDVHPSSEFVTLVLSSVYICFPIEGPWDAPLSYFRELVYTGWSIFSSLVKVKIHLDNSWQIYKKSKRNV